MNKALLLLFVSTIMLLLPLCGNKKHSGASNKNIPKISEANSPKPIVNVYVENTGSMFGYISAGNDFDRSISSLLTNIKVSGFADSINLFYINSRTFKQNINIPTFIMRTNQHNVQTWKGNLGRTEMCALFDTVTSSVTDHSVSIFVSDCIFSPGKGISAKKFIGSQKDCITMNINQKLKDQNLAFIVYRLLSDFKGTYFDCEDVPTKINDLRPYFIWIIGGKENIEVFKQKIPVSKIEGKLENSYTIFKNESNISYAVQLNPRIGNFERISPTKISNTRRDKDVRRFMFSIAVDFSSLLVDDSYLTDPKNYHWGNPNYNIEIIDRRMGNYTHLIKVISTANILSPTNLTIQLKNNIPQWVDDYSDETGNNITVEGMMAKTYGLKEIVRGIYAAFNSDGILSEIKVSINQ